ncbi:MAG: outer membrane lipoprotein-sorting protein [Myxococcota bacterium]
MKQWITFPTLGLLLATALPAAALTPAEVENIVKTIDERQRSPGDFKGACYIESKRKDKSDLIFEAAVYRRDEQEKFLFLVLKPTSESGKGWLRVEKNLFLYDPTVGKWDRRTERERMADTDARRSDLDASHLARDFTAVFKADDNLGGKQKAYKIELTAKPDAQVPYPRLEIWAAADTFNLLKELDYGESGKLMRSVYYPKWSKAYSESKKAEVYYPKEIRIFDEVEKGSSTTVQLDKIELTPLDPNIFTKAWIESKSK